jgi:putative acetyltransferase
MQLTLRSATENDAETILRLNLRSIFELCSGAYEVALLRTWVGNRTAENFKQGIAAGQMHLAESEGQAVGFIDVVAGEVLAVYVLPGFEKQGIGSFLLAAALQKAGAGDRPVRVVASHNAVPFYAKHGFQPVKEVKHARNGVELPLTEMIWAAAQNSLPSGCGNPDDAAAVHSRSSVAPGRGAGTCDPPGPIAVNRSHKRS